MTRRILLTTTLLLLVTTTSSLTACDDVLGVCLKTSSSPLGALVTKVNGNLARNLYRDNQRHYLDANQHVITAVNGQPVTNREECIEALKEVAGTQFTIDVFNVTRRTTKTYSGNNHAIQNVRRQIGQESTNPWVPGAAHPSLSHVVAGQQVGRWVPEPGYAWNNRRNSSAGVSWKWNQRHPRYSGIYSSRQEGKWNLQLGYQWLNNRQGDLRTKYVGTDSNGDWAFDTFNSQGGGYDAGLSNQFLRELNIHHSPYNYRGY